MQELRFKVFGALIAGRAGGLHFALARTAIHALLHLSLQTSFLRLKWPSSLRTFFMSRLRERMVMYFKTSSACDLAAHAPATRTKAIEAGCCATGPAMFAGAFDQLRTIRKLIDSGHSPGSYCVDGPRLATFTVR